MKIIPSVRVRHFGKKLREYAVISFTGQDDKELCIHNREYKGKSFTLSVWNIGRIDEGHIIAAFDTYEEAKAEVESIMNALEEGREVYRISENHTSDSGK